MPSDYERIGGGAPLTAVVDELYVRLAADPLVGHYFTDIDLPRQKRHMVLMLAKVLGGPDEYTGRALDDAHQPLDISDADYDARRAPRDDPRRGRGSPDDIPGRVVETLGAVRPQVVSRG